MADDRLYRAVHPKKNVRTGVLLVFNGIRSTGLSNTFIR